MNKQDIKDIFDYNYWANYHLLTFAEKLTPEQFVAPSTHSFSSIQGTLIHTLDMEWHWRVLLQGNGWMEEALNAGDFPTVAALRTRWQQDEAEMWDYLNGLSDDDLVGKIRYPGDPGMMRVRTVWHCLYHLVNHGMQHRSEVAHLLTGYDQSPGQLDFTIFLNEHRPPQAEPIE